MAKIAVLEGYSPQYNYADQVLTTPRRKRRSSEASRRLSRERLFATVLNRGKLEKPVAGVLSENGEHTSVILGDDYDNFLGGRKERRARRARRKARRVARRQRRREKRAARGGSRLGVLIRGSKKGRARRKRRRAKRGGSRLGVLIRGSKQGRARRKRRRAKRGGSRVGKLLRSGVGKAVITSATTAAGAVVGCPAAGTAAGMGVNKLLQATKKNYPKAQPVTQVSIPPNIARQQAEWYDEAVEPEEKPKTGLGVPLAIGGGLVAAAMFL